MEQKRSNTSPFSGLQDEVVTFKVHIFRTFAHSKCSVDRQLFSWRACQERIIWVDFLFLFSGGLLCSVIKFVFIMAGGRVDLIKFRLHTESQGDDDIYGMYGIIPFRAIRE